MNSTPRGWPRISSSLSYLDAPAAIDWLCRAFGFEVRLRIEGDPGVIIHSELTYGDGVVMIGSDQSVSKRDNREFYRSPKRLGGANTQSLFVYVDDLEAHCARARAAGATITQEIELHDYGEEYWSDKSYGCADCEGHHWWFAQRMRTPA